MATVSSSTHFLVLVCFLSLTLVSSRSIQYPSSSIASDQLNFWSKNVRNNMPKAVQSKLSPLSKRDTDYFTSLLTMQSFVDNGIFCAAAQLACLVDGGNFMVDESHQHQQVGDASSHRKDLNRYKPYVVPSGVNRYAPYVAKSSSESDVNIYKPYVEDSSEGSKLNSYKPYVKNEFLSSELNRYKPYVRESSEGSKLNMYKPYVVENQFQKSDVNTYKPYVADSSQESELNMYKPYVENQSHESDVNTYKPSVAKSSQRSGLNMYKPYVVENHSQKSDVNTYKPYVADSSQEFELNRYKPYVDNVNMYKPYVTGSTQGSELNKYEPYIVENQSQESDVNTYKPYVADSSQVSELNMYKPYVAGSSHGSEMNRYKPYVVENQSQESDVNNYKPYVADSSQESKLNRYKPYVNNVNMYKPYLADSSQKSELNIYKPYVADASQESELNHYKPYVVGESIPSGLNKYNPYIASASSGDELNKYRPYVGHESHHSMLNNRHTFFRLSLLEKGNKVPLPDSLNYTLPHRALLPTQIAKKIPLFPKQLKRIFPMSFVSPVTQNSILSTLSYCNSPAVKGDIKICATSLEDMIKFAKTILGKKHLIALTTESEKGSGSELMIDDIKNIDVVKYVACHELFLPFATHFCHFLSTTRLYSVSLVEPEAKTPVNKVLVMCHMQTSGFPADHVSLKALNLSPGQGEVCHWLSPTEIVWIGEGESMIEVI